MSAIAKSNCIEEYYKLINEAELAICDNKLQIAQSNYESAFNLNCNISNKIDLNNAIVVSGKLKKWHLARKYLLRLKIQGVKYQYLEKQLSTYFPSKKIFLKKIKQPPLLTKKEIIDTQLKLLFTFDQAVRRDCPFYQEHCVERVKYVDSILLIKFKNLIQENGGWPDDLSLNQTPGNMPHYFFLILHNSQWQRYWVQEEMEKALHKGQIPAYMYAYLISCFHDNNEKNIFPEYHIQIWYELNGKTYFALAPQANIDKINKNRASIYLCTIEEQKKKVKFQMQHPEYNLYPIKKVAAEISEIQIKQNLKNGIIEAYSENNSL